MMKMKRKTRKSSIEPAPCVLMTLSYLIHGAVPASLTPGFAVVEVVRVTCEHPLEVEEAHATVCGRAP